MRHFALMLSYTCCLWPHSGLHPLKSVFLYQIWQGCPLPKALLNAAWEMLVAFACNWRTKVGVLQLHTIAVCIRQWGNSTGTHKKNKSIMYLRPTNRKLSHLYRLPPPPHKRKWVACDLHAGTNNDEIKDSGKQQWGDKIKQSKH